MKKNLLNCLAKKAKYHHRRLWGEKSKRFKIRACKESSLQALSIFVLTNWSGREDFLKDNRNVV